MKVILLKTVEAHGKEGDVIDVSEGYARNFLFPQHAAIQASPQALQALKERKRVAASREQKALAKARTLATALDGFPLTLRMKANDQGKLFAAVAAKDVVKGLKKEGFEIEGEWIHFDKTTKEVGESSVRLEFPHGLEAEIQLTIEAE